MLASDLKRARHILSDEHGVWLSKADKPYTLKVFESYAKINLTSFAFKSRREGKYIINSWKSKSKAKLEIYQVETKLHVDTAIETFIYIDTPSKQNKKKTYLNTDFNYRTYIINDGNKPRLIFTIAIKGEHLNYSIGKHDISILYESVPVGLEIPNEKEIVGLTTKF